MSNVEAKQKVGIEAIAFDSPEYFLQLEDLAIARGVEPTKFTLGLGQKQMSVSSPCEDAVVLAATAGIRLLKSFDIDPKSIGLLIVGTETSVDHSKPVASYVHELLGIGENCRVYETKHACYAAMAGLNQAINWILSGRSRGKKALVIASDIAYYGLKTPGEPTQGSGAVAMLVSDQPDLLEVETHHEGFYSKQVMDFWRPIYSKEAFADGHYSIQCYLDALRGSYGAYKKSRKSSRYAENFKAFLYHSPFAKMAQKAHQCLLEADFDQVIAKDSPELMAAQEDFKKRVAPWLELNSRVGNIYTGSVFLGLLNFLQDGGAGHTGEFIGLFSYGSGCAAEFMEGKVGSNISAIKKLCSSKIFLDQRKRLSIEKYELMITQYSKSDLNGFEGCDPTLWNLQRPLVYLGTHQNQRRYQFNQSVSV